MGVSRSGYYKWKKRDKSTRDLKREEVIALVSEVHKAHPSHGYRWVAAFIRVNYQQDISDNYVYKAFRFLGIKAKPSIKYIIAPGRYEICTQILSSQLGIRRSASPGHCVRYDGIEAVDILS